jgi:hypothetical protein
VYIIRREAVSGEQLDHPLDLHRRPARAALGCGDAPRCQLGSNLAEAAVAGSPNLLDGRFEIERAGLRKGFASRGAGLPGFGAPSADVGTSLIAFR